MKKKIIMMVIGITTIVALTGCGVERDGKDLTVNGVKVLTTKSVETYEVESELEPICEFTINVEEYEDSETDNKTYVDDEYLNNLEFNELSNNY